MTPRKALFQRLPEIYRIRDTEQSPPVSSKPSSARIDERLRRAARRHRGALSRSLHRALRRLGHSLHRRSARHVAPGGRSVDAARRRRAHRAHSAPQRHARRHRVAGVIRSRGWAVHAVEMRERLVWAPASQSSAARRRRHATAVAADRYRAAVRGGMATLRDPATALACSADRSIRSPTASIVKPQPDSPASICLIWRSSCGA